MSEWLRRLSRPIGELIERRGVTGSEAEPLLGLVARMREAGEPAALITDVDGRVTGVLTAEDLIERALFTLEPHQPVAAALCRRVPALHDQVRVYQALVEMRRQRRNCLPVADAAGRPVGLIRFEGLLDAALAGLLGHLDSVVTSESAPPSRDAKMAQANLAAALLAADEPALDVIALVNAVNDDITAAALRQAVMTMSEAGWGEPPAPFAALVMGSAGRGESLLNPDQDNGFILADYAHFEHESVDRFFIELAQRFTRGLEQAGFPLCAGNVMASNPLWRKTLAQWQAQVTDWVRSRGNQEIMFTDIFFDFRAIFGSPELAPALRRHVTAAARDNLPFLAQISWLQHDRTSSVDLFGRLIAKDGPDNDAIDVKLRATKPLVEIVRLLALKNGIEATGTPARLAALAEAGFLAGEDAASLNADVTFVLELLLRHQIDRISAGRPPDNWIKPESLDPLERERLVQVCREIDRWRQRVVADYFPGLA
jgi:signal-transduction protein with cAMP-binding, CBS, and nucleotidyltransferase domain